VSEAMSGIVIRPATPADAEAIELLTLVAYFDVPGSRHHEHAAIAALREDGALSLSLLADHDGYVVGYLAASPATLSDGSRGWHAIGPLAVGPGHRGHGIAGQLLRTAQAQLAGLGAAGCLVDAEPGGLWRSTGFSVEPGLTLASDDVEAGSGRPLLVHAFGDRLPPLAEVTLHPALLPP